VSSGNETSNAANVIAATVDWKIVTIAAVLLLVAMILAYRLLNRDPDVRRTRYGLFVERDRYDDQSHDAHNAHDTLEYPTLEHPTLPRWQHTEKEKEKSDAGT
jgi:hypothetical protein